MASGASYAVAMAGESLQELQHVKLIFGIADDMGSDCSPFKTSASQKWAGQGWLPELLRRRAP